MSPEQAKDRLKDATPTLGSPSAEELAVLYEARADRARKQGLPDTSREYALKSAHAREEAGHIAVQQETSVEQVPVRHGDAAQVRHELATHVPGMPEVPPGMPGAHPTAH